MNSSLSENEFGQHWALVVVCAIGIGIGVVSLPFYTQGLFIEAWIKDFGWTRAQASFGILGSTLTLALVSPLVGAIVDRYGLARPVAASLLGLSIGFLLLGLYVQSVTTFVILAILQALLGSASSPLAYTRAINTVFDKQRGLALGFALSGTGIAAMVGPKIVGNLIETLGWRGAYFSLAGFTLVSGVIIVSILSRLSGAKTPPKIDIAASDTGFKEAVKTKTYWIMLGAMFTLSLGFGGMIVHFVPILLESGLTMSVATSTAGVIGIAVILGRIVVGAAVDKIFAPYVAFVVIFSCILGVLSLAIFGTKAAIPAAFVIGFSIGAEVDLIGYLVAKYFKMAAYGRIYGRQYAAFGFGTAFSPAIIGAIHDSTGNYQAAIYAAIAALSVSAVLFLFLPKFDTAPEDIEAL